MRTCLLVAALLACSVARAHASAPWFDAPLREFSLVGGSIAPGGPDAVVAADFDRDGRTDVVAGDAVNRTLTVLLGSTNGSLVVARTIPLPFGPTQLATADFNEDGVPDLAMLGADDNVHLYLGTGDGGFVSDSDATFLGMNQLLIADFNHDGHMDVAVLWGTFDVRYGNGDGSFQGLVRVSIGTEQQPPLGVAGDVDGDGWPDVLMTNGKIIRNRAGTYSVYTLVPAPTAVAIGDFDDIGRNEVLTFDGSTLIRWVSDASGGFSSYFTVLPEGVYDGLLRAVDLNGDGRLDLIGLGASGTVLLNNGGGFTIGPSSDFLGGPYEEALADVDGDGIVDLVIPDRATNAVAVGHGLGDGSFGRSAMPTWGNGVDLAVADLDGDGNLDAVQLGTNLVTMMSDGRGRFGDGLDLFDDVLQGPLGSLAVADVNGDGRPDIVVSENRPNFYYPYGEYEIPDLLIFLNNGLGSFLAPAHMTQLAGAGPITLADLDLDGRLDLLLVEPHHDVLLMKGSGVGSFSPYSSIALSGDAPRVVVGDVNGDGLPDIVVPSQTYYYITPAAPLRVYLAISPGRFGGSVETSTPGLIRSLVLRDVDGDGHLDAVWIAPGPQHDWLAVSRGRGDGSFEPADTIATSSEFDDVRSSDLNGDGIPDLVTRSAGHLTAFLGIGGGRFGPAQSFGPAGAFDLADLDGDGAIDVLGAAGGGLVPMRNQIGPSSVPYSVFDFDVAPVTPFIQVRFDGFGVGSDRVAVERAPSASGPWTSVSDATHDQQGVQTLVDSTITPGATYFYRMTASDPAGVRRYGPTMTTAPRVALGNFTASAFGRWARLHFDVLGGLPHGVVVQRAYDEPAHWATVGDTLRGVRGSVEVVDSTVTKAGGYYYRLLTSDAQGSLVYGPVPIAVSGPTPHFQFGAFSPNPARGSTTIEYSVAETSPVRLTICDVQGRELVDIVRGVQSPGTYDIVWEGGTPLGPARAGIYFVRYQSSKGVIAKRLTLLR